MLKSNYNSLKNGRHKCKFKPINKEVKKISILKFILNNSVVSQIKIKLI